MTHDQISHLKDWLARNKNFSLSIGTWARKSFLRIVAIEPFEDDQEVFYVPLDSDDPKHFREEKDKH